MFNQKLRSIYKMLTADKKNNASSGQPDDIHKDAGKIPASKNIRFLYHRDINNGNQHTRIYKEIDSPTDWWIN